MLDFILILVVYTTDKGFTIYPEADYYTQVSLVNLLV